MTTAQYAALLEVGLIILGALAVAATAAVILRTLR